MKPPRQVLLDRHVDAQASLDALRRSVVAPMRQRRRPWLEILWQELVQPIRPLLAGLSVVWLLILALHLATRGPSANGGTQPLPTSIAREVASQQRILSALLGLRPSETPESSEPRDARPPSGQLHRSNARSPLPV
jgi:hypothetical protein